VDQRGRSSDLRPQEAKLLREPGQPVEKDGQPDHDHQRAACDLDLSTMADEGARDCGRSLDCDGKQEEGMPSPSE